MRITVLGSGSQGNASLVEAGDTRLLVDAGLSPRILRERMVAAFGEAPERLDAVLVTHGHGDHAAHARTCAGAFDAELLMTRPTRRGLSLPPAVPTRELPRRGRLELGELSIDTLPVPHDLPQVALVFEHRGARAGLVTDLGSVRKDLVRHLDGCGAVLIESNFDPGLLATSDYPPEIQQRISGPGGHLSNEQCAGLLAQLGRATESVVLLHLSENNNEPTLARASAEAALRRRPRIRLRIAEPDRPLTVEVRPVAGQLELSFSS